MEIKLQLANLDQVEKVVDLLLLASEQAADRDDEEEEILFEELWSDVRDQLKKLREIQL